MISFSDIAAHPHATSDKLRATEEFSVEPPTYPNGTHIAEVEIDPDTGTTNILRYIVVDDFGATLNPLLLAGQVHGGAVQGIGQALMEDTVYDPGTGQLLSASFMDYAMPRAEHAPDFVFETRNVPCKTNPLGVKGAGEAGAIGSCPAVMNAIVDALWRAYQIRHIDMPGHRSGFGMPSAQFGNQLRSRSQRSRIRDRLAGAGRSGIMLMDQVFVRSVDRTRNRGIQWDERPEWLLLQSLFAWGGCVLHSLTRSRRAWR